jgi:hypothetical protein
MDAASLQPLKAIFESLEPTEVTAKHAWLFNRGNHHFRAGILLENAEARVLADQCSAVEEIAAVTSLDALIAYARTLELPETLGHALAASAISDVRKDELLDLALREEDPPIQHLAQRMIFVLRDARGVEWLWERFDRALQERRPDREILPFAFALPVNRATWERVAAAGLELDSAYWLRLRSFCIPRDEDLHVVVDKYLAVDRGRAALEMIGACHGIRAASSDTLRVLRDPSTVKTDGDAIGERSDAPPSRRVRLQTSMRT